MKLKYSLYSVFIILKKTNNRVKLIFNSKFDIIPNDLHVNKVMLPYNFLFWTEKRSIYKERE